MGILEYLLSKSTFFLMRSSYTYLAVSIVVFICWWIRVWKVYRAIFSEERLMQVSKS